MRLTTSGKAGWPKKRGGTSMPTGQVVEAEEEKVSGGKSKKIIFPKSGLQ